MELNCVYPKIRIRGLIKIATELSHTTNTENVFFPTESFTNLVCNNCHFSKLGIVHHSFPLKNEKKNRQCTLSSLRKQNEFKFKK